MVDVTEFPDTFTSKQDIAKGQARYKLAATRREIRLRLTPAATSSRERVAP